MTQTSRAIRPSLLIALSLGCGLVGALVGGWFQAHRGKAEVEAVVHDYLLANPEILPKAMEALQGKENAKALSGIRAEVERAWPGQVLGNPQGKVTLVEFTDFACSYCRHSVEDVNALVASNSELKVVIRQLPIIAPESADAARMGLAAAEQGKYAAFHNAMFAAGRPDAATITAVARSVGIDLVRAKKVIDDPRSEAELARNMELARQLGFNGTPSFVVGDKLIPGAVGREKLAEAIASIKG